MAPIKPTPAVQPMTKTSSKVLSGSLQSYKAKLRDSEKALAGMPDKLEKLQKHMEETQREELDPNNKFANKARVRNISNAKRLYELKEDEKTLPEKIETLRGQVKETKKELEEAVSREKRQQGNREAIGQQRTNTLSGKKPSPNNQYRDSVAPKAHITKPNVRAPGYGTQQRMARPARAASTAGRFQLAPNKFNRAALTEVNRNRALTSKLKSTTAASSSGDSAKPAMSGAIEHKSYRDIKNKTGGTTSSKSNRPSCSDESRASKRPAPDDDDDDDDDPPHKGDRHTLKKRKLAEAQKSSSAAPPATTTSSSGNLSKRPAPEDGEEGPASKRQKPSLNENDSKEDETSGCDSTKPANRPEKRRRPRGLINRKLACFSNAFIQMVDAALEDHDIDSVLGKLSDVKQFDNTRGDIKTAIEKAVQDGETAKVSPAKHLRRLIGQLRDDAGDDKLLKPVSPVLFQSVFAYGAPKDASSETKKDRERMSGDSQDDCFEYYQQVSRTLDEDTELNAEEKNKLKALFELQTETKAVCLTENCNHESSIPLKDTSNFHGVAIPPVQGSQTCSLTDLFRASRTSKSDDKCPSCGCQNMESRSIFTKVGDNLVVLMNRTGTGSHRRSKIMTKVVLDTNTIEPIDGNKYELSAVVYHEGPSARRGHYTICRKLGEKWFRLNDKKCTDIKREEVRDSTENGHSTMILWKKVQA